MWRLSQDISLSTFFERTLVYQNRSPSLILINWLVKIFSNVGPSSEPFTWSSASPPAHKSILSTERYNDLSFCATSLFLVIWLNRLTPAKHKMLYVTLTGYCIDGYFAMSRGNSIDSFGSYVCTMSVKCLGKPCCISSCSTPSYNVAIRVENKRKLSCDLENCRRGLPSFQHYNRNSLHLKLVLLGCSRT